MKVFTTIISLIAVSVFCQGRQQYEEQEDQKFVDIYQNIGTGAYYELDPESQQFVEVDPTKLDFYPIDEEAAANFEEAVASYQQIENQENQEYQNDYDKEYKAAFNEAYEVGFNDAYDESYQIAFDQSYDDAMKELGWESEDFDDDDEEFDEELEKDLK